MAQVLLVVFVLGNAVHAGFEEGGGPGVLELAMDIAKCSPTLFENFVGNATFQSP